MTASVASLGWTSRDFLGGGRILDLTSRVSKVGVGAPLDWGLADNICSASRDDTVGSAKLNYYLGASVRRPAFLSPNNAVTVSVFSERRSEYKVYLRQETGTSIALTRTHAAAAQPAFAHLHVVLRANRGHRPELLLVLQRLYRRRHRDR